MWIMRRRVINSVLQHLLFFLWMLYASVASYGQDCSSNLEDARRAYYNGNFSVVTEMITPCLEHELYNDAEMLAALELLTRANLMEGKDDQADAYMFRLLQHHPTYQVGSSDLVQFTELVHSYVNRTRFQAGVLLGFNRPHFSIMQYHSYASQAIQASDYPVSTGFAGGLAGEAAITNSFFFGLQMLYQSVHFEQRETIPEYMEMIAVERISSIRVPFYLKHQFTGWRIQPFIMAGVSPDLLVASVADISLLPIASAYPRAFTGTPRSVDNYDLSDQRRRLTLNYFAGGGVRIPFGLSAIELSLHYEYGYHNLVKEEMRYADQELTSSYSYVPDDFKMDQFRFMIGWVRSFVVPQKRRVINN